MRQANESHVFDSERALAGSLLLEPFKVFREIQKIVSASDFQSESARAVFSATASLIRAGKPCDPVLVKKEIAETGVSVSDEYLVDAMSMTPTANNAPEYARLVHEAAINRSVSEIGLRMAEGECSALEGISQLQEIVRTQSSSRVLSPREASQGVMEFISLAAQGESRPFIKTGFRELDRILSGGLVSGGLITIAARPGTGKSTAAICIAENVSSSGGAVLYISLEMTLQQIWCCRIARLTEINRSAVYSGAIDLADTKRWKQINKADSELSARPFYVSDTPYTIEDIEREARCIDGLSLIVVDHMGLVKPQKSGSRYEIMTDTAHRLKQLALSMKIPIIALCQLNRATAPKSQSNTPPPRPTMADLRDSGAIEEDSDVVILLYRDEMYLPDDQKSDPGSEQELICIVDKNRHGQTGSVFMGFRGSTSEIIG